MSGTYREESIPSRGSGRQDRSFDPAREKKDSGYRQPFYRRRDPDEAGRSRSGSVSGSSWTFISEQELFGGYRSRSREISGRNLPEKIRALLEMTAQYEVEEEKRTEAFLKQARFMADYEDDFDMKGEPGHHIFTAYQEMTADELRGYFSWRTRIRRGEMVRAGRDFLRLYAAELINLIGVSSAGEAFDCLLRLQAAAREGERVESSLKGVIRDFCIAYSLDHEVALEYCIADPAMEAADLALSSAYTADDYSLYEAILTVAGDRVASSKFLPQVREDACHVIARAVRRISIREKELKGKGFIERLAGPRRRAPHLMFAWLPYQPTQPDGYCYEVDPVRTYEYSDGKWYCRCCSPDRNPDEIRYLDGIIRECERLLRKALHYKNALPDRRRDPKTAELIRGIIEEWLQEKAARNRPEVRIDLTKLTGIREAADITRDRLLEGTQEGAELPDTAGALWNAMAAPEPALADPGPEVHRMADQPVTASGQTADRPVTVPGQAAGQTEAEDGARAGIFTPEEAAFLKLLLDGKPWKEYIDEKHLMLSVFADSINEKAYDEIGDTILEIEDGIPELIEDYTEDVRELLQ